MAGNSVETMAAIVVTWAVAAIVADLLLPRLAVVVVVAQQLK